VDATPEEWRPVVGYEGSYEVSNRGRVRSLDGFTQHGHRMKGRVLKPWLTSPRPYPCITLGHKDKRYIHKLVLESFVGPCPPGMEVLHENDDPSDNRLENLRWDCRSENIRDRVRLGTHNNAKKTHCKRGHDLAGAYIKADGARQCRQCLREAYQRKTKEKESHYGSVL
jgi:NUMOD4 motif/HNH endonuclease